MKTIWIIFSCHSALGEVTYAPKFDTSQDAKNYASKVQRAKNHLLLDFRVYSIHHPEYKECLREDVFKLYRAIGHQVEMDLINRIADMEVSGLEKLQLSLSSETKTAILG